MTIVNQDRDQICGYDPSTSRLYSGTVKHNGLLMGFNVYCDQNFLGTFDTPLEAMREIQRIRYSELDVYYVSGY